MKITDEMVDKASRAGTKRGLINMRDALEAVAPMLIAQGMREGADLIKQAHVEFRSPPYTYIGIGTLLNRAQELDPQ